MRQAGRQEKSTPSRWFDKLATGKRAKSTKHTLLCGRGFQPREPHQHLPSPNLKALKIISHKIMFTKS